MPSPYFAFRALSAKLDGTVNIRRWPGVSKVDGPIDFRRWSGVWPASGSPDEPASGSKPPSPTKEGSQIDGFWKYEGPKLTGLILKLRSHTKLEICIKEFHPEEYL